MEGQSLSVLSDVGQFPVAQRLRVLNPEPLFTLNSGVLLPKQEGRPLRPGPYCGGASDTGASDTVRRQDFRVGQAGYNPGLLFHACALEPVSLPGLSGSDPGDMLPSDLGYTCQVLGLAGLLLSDG